MIFLSSSSFKNNDALVLFNPVTSSTLLLPNISFFKEDWVVFDDTQEPIVDEETWLLAQKLRQNVRKADPMGEPNVLTGKIYCADCGAPMYNHRERKGRERIYYTAKEMCIRDREYRDGRL